MYTNLVMYIMSLYWCKC